MDKKYVLAKITLPLYILQDGTIEAMTDYIKMDIEPCETLPDKKETDLFSKEMNEKIFSLCNMSCHSENKQEEKPLFVLKEEILSYQHKPASEQRTLKIYHRPSSSSAINKTAKRQLSDF